MRVAALLLPLFSLLLVGPTASADTSIDYVEPANEQLEVVVSVDQEVDASSAEMATVNVTFNGAPLPATAQPLSAAEDRIERTAMLAIDVSRSMRGDKFTAARAAARAFLDGVPDDVNVGLVTFAGKVNVVTEPTQDHAEVLRALDGLTLSLKTRLYDGLARTVEAAGDFGARSALLLSDGRDTSDTKLSATVDQVTESGVNLDVVALAQGASGTKILERLAAAGNGVVLNAEDPEALKKLFAQEAANLARQVLVTVTPTPDLLGTEGTLEVTLQVDGEPATDTAFVALPPDPQDSSSTATAPPVTLESGPQIPVEYMYAGLVAAALAFVTIVLLLFGGKRDMSRDALERSIEAYTRQGARKLAEANRDQQSQSMKQQAVSVAENMLDSQKGLETRLGARLEAAGLAFKPAEWLLIHVGITIGAGFLGLLLGGGSPLYMLGAAFFAAVAAWMYLARKHKRRLKAFKNQLADTLQLLSGSLSAGLSLAQSADAVVREGTNPMASEFRRALIEARLGVEIEDAMESLGQRMESVDFEWVVMAIRIQRQVGGNLSELLNKVAETIREREYLERQVLALSAEGRLSVWILGGLPPAFMGYLLLANPSYISVMFTSPLGIAMLIVMVVLLSVGILWMKKVVKVEV